MMLGNSQSRQSISNLDCYVRLYAQYSVQLRILCQSWVSASPRRCKFGEIEETIKKTSSWQK